MCDMLCVGQVVHTCTYTLYMAVESRSVTCCVHVGLSQGKKGEDWGSPLALVRGVCL